MDTKKKILYVAAERFAKDGYYRASIRDICTQAGVNIASVNYHFNGKAELYRKVHEFLFNMTEKTSLEERTDFASFKEWQSYLNDLISGFFLNISSSQPIYRWKIILFAREMMEPTENFPLLYEFFLKPRLSVLKACFKYAFPKETTDKIVYLEVFSVLSQILFYAQNRELVTSVFGKDFYSEDNLRKVALDIVDGFYVKIRNKYNGRI